MQYQDLPGTGLKVSRIAFGTWGLGGPPFWQKTDENDATALLEQSLASGINFFDTAPVYGLGWAESLLGKILNTRAGVTIASKVGVRWKNSKSFYRDLSQSSIFAEIDASRRRLRRDRIDICQVHWPDRKTPLAETFTALEKAREQGMIAHIGVSNFSVEMLLEARKYAQIATVQPRFNYLDQRAAASLLPYCQKRKIGTLVYSPLASGLLSNPEYLDEKHDDWRGNREADLFNPSKRATIRGKLAEADKQAGADDMALATWSLRWVLKQPGVNVAILGLRRTEHLQILQDKRLFSD
jgi:aryl-alcohol dehydrogenase-like predicted oxidoreductase